MPVPAAEAAPTYLGIETEPNLGGGIGVRIVAVGARLAGMASRLPGIGDVIQAVDGFAISDLDVLADRLSRKRAGESVKMLVLRAGRNTGVDRPSFKTLRLHNESTVSFRKFLLPLLDRHTSESPSPIYPPRFDCSSGSKSLRGAAVTNVAVPRT
ncbi:MAG: hypothetical protein U0892_17420 [Pirellulales bacterium]